jgi:hypothetical protein
MKQFVLFLMIVLSAFLFINENSYAQNQDPPLLICSFNQVGSADVGKVNKMVDSVFAPILNELVDEGFIISWGQFNHAWGDEWNVNLFYTVKDMTSFEKFWDEYVDRGGKRHPRAFAETTQYFKAHKDNIYVLRNAYPSR